MSVNGLMNQQITISSKTGYNAYGRETVSTALNVWSRFQKTSKLVTSATGSLKTILAIVYVPSDTTVAIDDKITYDSVDYKVDGIYDAVDGVGRKNHIKLELTAWKAT